MINDNEKLDLLLAGYNDPDLSEAQRLEIENRVRTDPEARKRLAEYQRLDDLLSGLPSLAKNVDFDHFSDGVSRAIRSTTIKSKFVLSWENIRFRRVAIPAAAAAVMATALVIWATLTNRFLPQSEFAGKTAYVRVMAPQAPVQIAGKGNYVKLFNSGPKGTQAIEKIVTPVEVCLNQEGSGSPGGNFTYDDGEVIYFATPPSSRPIETAEENFSAYF
jgi:hypothetical protein